MPRNPEVWWVLVTESSSAPFLKMLIHHDVSPWLVSTALLFTITSVIVPAYVGYKNCK